MRIGLLSNHCKCLISKINLIRLRAYLMEAAPIYYSRKYDYVGCKNPVLIYRNWTLHLDLSQSSNPACGSNVPNYGQPIHGNVLINENRNRRMHTFEICINFTLSQCTLAGPVYTGMPLVDPVYTGIPLGHPANNCRVHWSTTGVT